MQRPTDSPAMGQKSFGVENRFTDGTALLLVHKKHELKRLKKRGRFKEDKQ
jgi:hypothetical protein